VSGVRAERPVLQQTLAQLRAGDVLLIWKLDRLGRSLRHLIEVVTDLAEFECDLIRERTQPGWSPPAHGAAAVGAPGASPSGQKPRHWRRKPSIGRGR
jgi:DNA invertase Pin-like site-specific DNA recombinase